MGYYEDHLEAVAKRRAGSALKFGVDVEKSILLGLGWTGKEAEQIINKERAFLSNGKI